MVLQRHVGFQNFREAVAPQVRPWSVKEGMTKVSMLLHFLKVNRCLENDSSGKEG